MLVPKWEMDNKYEIQSNSNVKPPSINFCQKKKINRKIWDQSDTGINFKNINKLSILSAKKIFLIRKFFVNILIRYVKSVNLSVGTNKRMKGEGKGGSKISVQENREVIAQSSGQPQEIPSSTPATNTKSQNFLSSFVFVLR